MKLLLFSDSHGNINNMANIIKKFNKIDLIIHLGDMVNDAIKLKELFNNINFEIVRGNNDYSNIYPTEKILEIDNKRIFLIHGHTYGVKYSYDKLINKCISEHFDATFFGHTHNTEQLYLDKAILINPGSIGSPNVGNSPTFCMIEINSNGIYTKFFNINM